VRTSSLAGVLVVSVLAGCDGGVDVTYRRTTGEVREYVRTLDVEGANPSGVRGRVRQEVTTRETAVEVRRREMATVQVEVKRILVEVFRDGPEPLLKMDSDVPEDPAVAGKAPETEAEKFAYFLSPLRFLAGAKVDLEQMNTGQVVRPSGVDEVKKRILAALPEGDARRGMAEGFPWGTWFLGVLRPALCVPRNGAKEGEKVKFVDQRTLPETVGTGGFMYYAGTSWLGKVENGKARMEMEAEVFLDPVGPSLQPWPRELAPRRRFLRLQKGTCRAWARIDVETGVLEEDEHVTDLDLHFLPPGDKPEVAIPTKVTLRSKRVK
jgi:hypothetical protein